MTLDDIREIGRQIGQSWGTPPPEINEEAARILAADRIDRERRAAA